MIIKRLYFIFVLLMTVAGTSAQELTIEGMELSGADLSASTDRRVDNKGKSCALVKVQLAVPGAQFEGNIIEPTEFKNGEYWVYMPDGSSQMTVKVPSYPSITVNFIDYAIDEVRSLTTYMMTINVPSDGTFDDGKRFLRLFVEQAGARGPLFEADETIARRFISLFDVKVYVDDQLQELHNGWVTVLLSRGKHTYRVEHPGYATVSEMIEIINDNIEREISLKKVVMNVTLTCPTSGAKFYVDGKECGMSPYVTQLEAGTVVQARLDGYRTKSLKVTLSEKNEDNQTVNFPALEPIEGSIRIDYTPADCEVLIDGKRLGTPGLYDHQLIGRHAVEIRKDGYLTENDEVIVTEGHQTTLKGMLLKEGTADMSICQMIKLGQDYEYATNGKKRNVVEAAKLYKKAAELGNAKAQCLWGEMLENGCGVEADPVEAVRWYRKSAEQGNPDGQYRLGMSYEIGYGRGLTPNRNTAYQWYQKAADQGHSRAQELIYKQKLREQYGGARRR